MIAHDSSYYFSRGRAHESAGDLPAAARDYGRALRLDRRAAEVYFRRFVARTKMGDHLRGVEDLNRAHALDRSFLWEGRGSRRDGVPAWSLDHAISRFPRRGWFYAWRGLTASSEGRFEDAERDLETALRLGARSPLVRGWRALNLRRRKNRGRSVAPERKDAGLGPADAPLAAARLDKVPHLGPGVDLTGDGILEAFDHLRTMTMLQDFLAVFYSLRPAAFYYDLPKKTLDALALLCGRTGMRMGLYRDPATRDSRCVWSRDAALLAHNIKDGNRGGDALPQDTGYPKCCIRANDEILREYPDLRKRPPTPALAARGTKRLDGEYDYRMNFLYHMESRDQGKRGLKGKRFEYSQFHLLPWTPCSFECAESLRYVAVMEKILKLSFPRFAAQLAAVLRRPVVSLGDFELASLEGERIGRTALYRAWLDPTGFFPSEAGKIIDRGDRLVEGEAGVSVFRGGRAIGRMRKGCELFFFSERPGGRATLR
jgi:tetratricopeptide (TPR) repeat protein